MTLERRGKYPGVKIHLDEVETRRVLDILFNPQALTPTHPSTAAPAHAFKFVAKMAKLIEKELVADPTLLDQRTIEEITLELTTERDKAIAKLAKIQEGQSWNAST